MSDNKTFYEMPLSHGMKETITNIGFKNPTPIQQRAIPELLLGHDLLGQAQTGTGKTAAFAIPLVEMVDVKAGLQALVVCPTRELCLQVCQEVNKLSAHREGIVAVALYGGQAIEQQFKALKVEQPQIVVATPGRLFDHLRRKSVVLSGVRMIVLDEADEMLDMGFRPEIEQIFSLLPDENQRIFFSATMAKAIKDLACAYLREPKVIQTESKTLTGNTISQSYFRVRGREKTDLLCRMLDFKDPKLCVVFCNAKSTVDEVAEEIKNSGFDAGVLHGDLSQNQRDRVMARFRSGLIRVLVATDVAARGLDIDNVELVINFHLPHDPEDYVHRIGRTGRAGRQGYAISLVEPRDNTRLRRIGQFAKIEIVEKQPPTLADVKTAKLTKLFGSVKDALSSERISEYRSFLIKQRLPAEDVAAGLLQLALKNFDDRPYKEEAFDDLKDRKYSGRVSEEKWRKKSGRVRRSPGFGNPEGRKFSDNNRDRNGRAPFGGHGAKTHVNDHKQYTSERDAGWPKNRHHDQRYEAPFESRKNDRTGDIRVSYSTQKSSRRSERAKPDFPNDARRGGVKRGFAKDYEQKNDRTKSEGGSRKGPRSLDRNHFSAKKKNRK